MTHRSHSILHTKHTPEKLEPYPVDIFFLKGKKEWVQASSLSNGWKVDAYAATCMTELANGNRCVLFYMSDMSLKEEPISTLVHETAHAATYVADYAGFPPGVGKTSEPFAYLSQQIAEKACKFYKIGR